MNEDIRVNGLNTINGIRSFMQQANWNSYNRSAYNALNESAAPQPSSSTLSKIIDKLRPH